MQKPCVPYSLRRGGGRLDRQDQASSRERRVRSFVCYLRYLVYGVVSLKIRVDFPELTNKLSSSNRDFQKSDQTLLKKHWSLTATSRSIVGCAYRAAPPPGLLHDQSCKADCTTHPASAGSLFFYIYLPLFYPVFVEEPHATGTRRARPVPRRGWVGEVPRGCLFLAACGAARRWPDVFCFLCHAQAV